MTGIEGRLANLDVLDGIVRKKDKTSTKLVTKYESDPDLEAEHVSEEHSEFSEEYRPRSYSERKATSATSVVKSMTSRGRTVDFSEDCEEEIAAAAERKPAKKLRYHNRARRTSHYHVQWAGETVITSDTEESEDHGPRPRSYSDASHQRAKPRSILKYPRPEKPTCVVFVHAD